MLYTIVCMDLNSIQFYLVAMYTYIKLIVQITSLHVHHTSFLNTESCNIIHIIFTLNFKVK